MRRAFGLSSLSLLALVWACGGDDPSASSSGASGSSSGGSSGGASSSGTASSSGSSGDDGGGVDGGPAPILDPNFVYADFNHILLTGQSNAVANSADPITTTQPYSNVMFDVGTMTGSQCDGEGCQAYDTPTSFVPLVEGDTFFTGFEVETSASGFANEATKLAREFYLVGKTGAQADHVMLASNHGRSGRVYNCLRKGGCNYITAPYTGPFEEGVKQMQDGHALATTGANAGKTHVVRAIWAIHGESDSDTICIENDPDYNANYPTACDAFTDADGELPPGGTIKNYSDMLLEWQSDYDVAAKAVTGQAQSVPLFVSQYSGWKDTTRSKIPPLQLDAHTRAAGKVILVGPGYMLDFQGDFLHYTSESQRKLGEYFAKAYAETILGGRPWEPLRPIAITRAGATVTVKFKVPKPPLVIDTTRVTDPGSNGFEFSDDSGMTPAITNVALSGADTVVITLASAPTGGNQRVRYAMKATKGAKPGHDTGPRGNLRDSDPTPSQYGNELFNWAVHFDLPVQ